MLETVKIIALLQGIFVLAVLFVNRNDYKKITFRLLIGCLISVLLYIVADDGNNLFAVNSDWFLFDKSLFVTFLFLFFKYDRNGAQQFLKRDLLFFLPNVFYLILEVIEIVLVTDNPVVEFFEILVELIFISYLVLILCQLTIKKIRHWLVYFVVPIIILFIISFINDILKITGFAEIKFSGDDHFNTYLLLIVSFLFYFISFKLLTKSTDILQKNAISKYKNSTLNNELIEAYKIDLINAMEKDKLYRNGKLSIHEVSLKLDIPRQYISEVLNEHMNTSFQDFVNQYRVEEFVERLKNDQNKHFTLLAIATDVGFSSKSSFNAIFKKIKGLTPTEFKKSLSDTV